MNKFDIFSVSIVKRLLVTSFFFIAAFNTSKAQLIEYGGGVGAFNYSGDLIRGFQVSNATPGIFGVYRLNLSNAVSTRFSLTYGSLQGSDDNPIDPFARQRDFQFKINMLELSAAFEYYFLDFKSKHARVKFSPYVFAGFGLFKIYGRDFRELNYNSIQPALPFGVGYKQLINRKFSVSVEYGARRTFFDRLDDLSDGDQALKNFQYGNPNDPDWYHFVGISFTYILWDIPCPFPYIPNNSIYK